MSLVGEYDLVAAGESGGIVDAGGGRVDADLIRRLARYPAGRLDPRGVRLRDALVTGPLDLSGIEVAVPLAFDGCTFTDPVRLDGADLPGLAVINGSRLPGLLANGVRVHGDLDLSHSRITGAHRTGASTSRQAAIWLCESTVDGRVLCEGTVIEAGDRALQGDRMVVGGPLRLLHGFSAIGEIRLVGARIGGSVDLSGACLAAPGRLALDLADASLGGSLLVIADRTGRRATVTGPIKLAGAQVAGQIVIRNADLRRAGGPDHTTPAGPAISAPRLRAAGEITIDGDTVIEGGLNLAMSDLSGLTVAGGATVRAAGARAVNLTNAELRASLVLAPGTTVDGTVRLASSRVHGRLEIRCQSFAHPEGPSLLSAKSTVIDGDVILEGLRATGGRLDFRGAVIGGLLNLEAAVLDNPSGYTVTLRSATVRGSVRLVDDFHSNGVVDLIRSTVEGRLDCRGGTFQAPARSNYRAITAISGTFRGGMYLGWRTIPSGVDLTDAVTTVLIDDPERWPERFRISGLTYDRFGSDPGAFGTVAVGPAPSDLHPPGPTAGGPGRAWDPRLRCRWLARQERHDSGPYEQLARVYRQHGHADWAERVLVEQRTRARRAAGRPWYSPGRAFNALYGWSVGYGYRPGRSAWALAGLLALMYVLLLAVPAFTTTLRATDGNGVSYSVEPRPGTASCTDGKVRCFEPFTYAVDTVIPLVSLGQRSTWYVNLAEPGGGAVYAALTAATLLGWLLSSILFLSFARLARGTNP
jgi:hypothetical protein